MDHAVAGSSAQVTIVGILTVYMTAAYASSASPPGTSSAVVGVLFVALFVHIIGVLGHVLSAA